MIIALTTLTRYRERACDDINLSFIRFVLRTATQAWRQKFAKIAKDHPEMSFAVADEEDNSDLFNEFGFDDSGEEVNVGIIGPGERKYPMEPMEEFESDEVEKFLRTFMKGMPTLFNVSYLKTCFQCKVIFSSSLHAYVFSCTPLMF